MTKKIFYIVFMLIMTLLTSCSSNIIESNIKLEPKEYNKIILSASVNYPTDNYIYFYNKDTLVSEYKWQTPFDLYYQKIVDNKLYMFNAGVYCFDFESPNINKITDKTVTSITINNDDIYYYENCGFIENGYLGYVYKNNTLLFECDGIVEDMIVYNDKLYLLIDTIFNGYYLGIYDGEKVIELSKDVKSSKFIEMDSLLYLIGYNYYAIIENDTITINGFPLYMGSIKLFKTENKYFICNSSYILNESYIYEATIKDKYIQLVQLYKFDSYGQFADNLFLNQIIFITRDEHSIYNINNQSIKNYANLHNNIVYVSES